MRAVSAIVVVIVSFRSAADVAKCIAALRLARRDPAFDVFVVENGGPTATGELLARLTEGGLARSDPDTSELFVCSEATRQARLLAKRPGGMGDISVTVAESNENLGYAGAVNTAIRALLPVAGWRGIWVLNPDTEPTPTALSELVACSEHRHKPMVGSRLVSKVDSACIHSRGLTWDKLAARTVAVDYHAAAATDPDLADVEARIDAPSGASLFVTRRLIETIGLMDERFFLYFEDLDWGRRAKDFGGVGYAHTSVVSHRGKSTTHRAGKHFLTSLSTYLEFRNSILYVRKQYPRWLPWTVVMQFIYAIGLLRGEPFSAVSAAVRGLLAGVFGEIGRPDQLMGPKGWRADG